MLLYSPGWPRAFYVEQANMEISTFLKALKYTCAKFSGFHLTRHGKSHCQPGKFNLRSQLTNLQPRKKPFSKRQTNKCPFTVILVKFTFQTFYFQVKTLCRILNSFLERVTAKMIYSLDPIKPNLPPSKV